MIETYIDTLPENLPTVFKPNVGKYYNIACGFDIETTSFVDSCGQKTAIMYAWVFSFQGEKIIGRDWESFLNLYLKLKEKYCINLKRRLVIYVHNLAFEFQFIRKLFSWEQVFSLDERKVVKAVTSEGIEFRCSYVLTGYSLKKLGEQLVHHDFEKKDGDLDYSLMRHSQTPLSEKEIGYIEGDADVMVAYIQEQLEIEDIVHIPLTNTGYVRRECKQTCFENKSYSKKIKSLTMTVEEYKMLKLGFMGGFTHANHNYVDKVLNQVASFDLTSAYPAVMLTEYFPMSIGEKYTVTTVSDFENCLKQYCCLFQIKFKYLTPKIDFEHYLSVSKCVGTSIIEDNGRIVSAKEITTVMTEIDYQIMKQCYHWDSIEVGTMYRYRKGRLPKEIIMMILKLYEGKTTLKGVDDKVVEYMKSKGMLNSTYGMCVTDPVRDEILYTENWHSTPANLEECIAKYNQGKGRFLFYPWGIWTTAYNRKNLWTAILAVKDDYIYSDTDSCKFLNYEKHKVFFEKYNQMIQKKLELLSKDYKIDFEQFQPKDIKGKKHLIGVFDFEGVYEKFKTLGAKRYLTYKNSELKMTVSGVDGKKAVSYLTKKYDIDKIYEIFTDDLIIPKEYSGKNVHTYIDDEKQGYLIDYLGNKAEYLEYSGVHLDTSEYHLSLSEKFINYLRGYIQVE